MGEVEAPKWLRVRARATIGEDAAWMAPGSPGPERIQPVEPARHRRPAATASYNVPHMDTAQPRPTRITVDLDRLAGNLQAIRAHTGRPVMAVVKANAYGHGMLPVARRLQAAGVEQLGVALLEEGMALRAAGIEVPILVFGGIVGEQLDGFFRHDLQITVSSLAKLRQVEAAARRLGRRARIHLKIDTGMERVGTHSDTCGPLIEAALAAEGCEIAGVYSHLACADEPDHPMTALQLQRFEAACAHFTRLGAPMPLRHLANSGGILHFPHSWLDMVRPGILLYGVLPGDAARATVPVQPVLGLRSQVVYFKVVAGGHPVSYGGTWQREAATRVVTVQMGYGDGWPRSLSSVGEVLIGGRRHTIAGRVCMDQFMVDIGQDSAFNGDEVVLIGEQGGQRITVEDVARSAGTIAYEILVRLNERIPRIHLGAVAA